MLPGFVGEVSIVYLFKKALKIDYSNSSQALLVVRIVDFVLFSLVFLFTFLFIFRDFISNSSLVRNIIGSLIVLVLICLCFAIFMVVGRKIIYKFLELRFFRENPWGRRTKRFTANFLSQFKASLSLKSVAWLSTLSLLLWFFLYLFFVASVRAIGVDLSYLEIFFIFLILWPINILPVRGPGNLGTHELGWVAALTLLGHTRASASLIAFGTHTVFILCLFVIFLLLLAVYGKKTFLMIIDWSRNQAGGQGG